MSSARRGAARGRNRGPSGTTINGDKDGDLQMGDAPTGPAAGSRFNPYGSNKTRGRHTRQPAGSIPNRLKAIEMTVTGTQGASVDDLVAFILRKCKVRISNIRGGGDRVTCSVYSPDDAKSLQQASGLKFAGHTLQIIQLSDSATHSQASAPRRPLAVDSSSTIETLKQFLMTRYSPENKMLDLSRMADDPVLSNYGIVANTSTSSKLFLALMKLLTDEKKEVISVSMESNKLKDVAGISALAQHFPKLRNLSLAQNDIRKYQDLGAWSSKNKLANLQELILTGNPVREQEISKGREVEYRSEITKRFPSLKLLDGAPIAQGITFDVGTEDALGSNAPIRVQLPAPIAPGFYENETIQSTAMDFLGNFFPVYDADRSGLAPFYAENAIFSMSMNATAPRKKSGGAFAAGAWQNYQHSSRNLTRITALDARITRTSVGTNQIIEALKHLPVTSHDLSDASLFCVDAWSFPTSEGNVHVQVCVHGEFKEKAPQTKQSTKRSFDRTFILGPAANGTGINGVIIKSDLLLVRSWGGSDAWASTQEPVATSAAADTIVASLDPRPPGIDDKQFESLQSLRSQTGLNTNFALMCLTQMNWDLAAALKVTHDLKAQNGLPQEAFIA